MKHLTFIKNSYLDAFGMYFNEKGSLVLSPSVYDIVKVLTPNYKDFLKPVIHEHYRLQFHKLIIEQKYDNDPCLFEKFDINNINITNEVIGIVKIPEWCDPTLFEHQLITQSVTKIQSRIKEVQTRLYLRIQVELSKFN